MLLAKITVKSIGIFIGSLAVLGGLLADPSKAQTIRIVSLLDGTEKEHVKENEIIDSTVEGLTKADKWFAKVFPNREYVIYVAPTSFPSQADNPGLPSENDLLFKSPWLLVEKKEEFAFIHIDATHYRPIVDTLGNEELKNTFLPLDHPSESCMDEMFRKRQLTTDEMECVPERWRTALISLIAGPNAPYPTVPTQEFFARFREGKRCKMPSASVYHSIYATIAENIARGKENSIQIDDLQSQFECSKEKIN